MAWSSVHLLPLSVFVLLPSTFLLTYVISVLLDHVEIEWPYISDTGTKVPESCIFAQLLNLVSFLTALTIYVRYKQIEQYYRDHLSVESGFTLSRNWIAFCIGIVSCFGLSVVANFQERNIFRVHMIGALLCFGCGVIYCAMQTWLSFRMVPLVNSIRMARFRLFLTCLMFCTCSASTVLGPYAFSKMKPGRDPTKWQPDDGGYHLHVASSICEWISAMSLDFFILTFVREMHRISISSPRIVILVETLNLPSSGDGTMYQSDEVEIVRSDRRSMDKSLNSERNDYSTYGSSSRDAIIH
ncbi:transmembrane protein-like protein [Leptotrombidium deliense]|uniref:Transmembrane protein-like protein n=1 Tax=Leptotrombidium deliense TaxID=299467 RepID=A0A443SQ17_9ACAR|nr:transmembrane protein-like protein [Leptotrombidium deliense]